MSLRKQLTEILPPLLPSNPSEAIKGTELIRLVRLQLTGNYSDASLRYHFSIMSCDPASPIAKVEKGQGYYRRTAPVPALSGAQALVSMSQGRLEDLNTDRGAVDLALERVRKFRAVVTRLCERLDGPDELDAIARQVVARFDQPVAVDGHAFAIGISVGGALAEPGDEAAPDGLILRADRAMYAAKAERGPR